MITAALLTIAKIGKQPRWPSTDDCIKKMWYLYTMECCSAIKTWSLAICNNVDGPRGHYPKWNKSQTNTIWFYLYVESKKNKQNRNRPLDTENTLMFATREGMRMKRWKGPGWCGSVDWAWACEPKGCWFDSQSGHTPGLWARSPVGTRERQPHIDVSLPLFLPPLHSL